MDYMTSNEGLLFTNFGVEGQDFYYDDDGYVRRTEAGEQRYEQKRVTGLGIWWNFTIDAWYNSVIPIPAEESQEKSCYDIQTALGKESYVYDMGLLSISRQFWEENPKEAEIKSTVEAYQKKQILRIITAESEEEFQREYEKLLQRQGELGIVQLDEKINEQVQKNFETYEKRIDKVN